MEWQDNPTTTFRLAALALAIACSIGCGTTRSTDSARTATEQLLISDAIDRAVQSVDFQPLAGQSVHLDDSKLENVVDREYLVSCVRQHLLASGCTLRNNRSDADFVVEARAGAVGTDRNDLLFGIPATNVPQILPVQGVPAAIPEVPLAKRRDQRGVAKISMFAYHRETGLPVWQSGVAARESSSNDVWLFGAGPFQYGSVQQAAARNVDPNDPSRKLRLAQQVTFASPAKLAEKYRRLPPTTKAVVANIAEPAEPEPLRLADHAIQPLIPGLAEVAAPRKEIRPTLTGRITHEELRRNSAPQTVELEVPPPDTDPIALPQPRFNSL